MSRNSKREKNVTERNKERKESGRLSISYDKDIHPLLLAFGN